MTRLRLIYKHCMSFLQVEGVVYSSNRETNPLRFISGQYSSFYITIWKVGQQMEFLSSTYRIFSNNTNISTNFQYNIVADDLLAIRITCCSPKKNSSIHNTNFTHNSYCTWSRHPSNNSKIEWITVNAMHD